MSPAKQKGNNMNNTDNDEYLDALPAPSTKYQARLTQSRYSYDITDIVDAALKKGATVNTHGLPKISKKLKNGNSVMIHEVSIIGSLEIPSDKIIDEIKIT